MDFDERYRGEMIRYAAERYGWDRVAQIVTFSTIKARAAVRDAARVLGYPYSVGDRIAKAMPPLVMGRDTPLWACLEEHPKYADGYKAALELRQMCATDPDAAKVVEVARGLEGLRRQDGIHAAAVVISGDPLTEYLPIQRKPEPGGRAEDAPIVTQYEMHGVEDLGLLKMDFLGLRNLSVIERTLDLIEAATGERPDIDRVPLDDRPHLRACSSGATPSASSSSRAAPMRNLVRSLAPTEFEDVAALVALYRPGPMAANMHNDYADRKNGRQPVTYQHPDMEEVLGDTYGLCVYQEQMMLLAQKFAGYSLAEADNLRKAAGKKVREIMAAGAGEVRGRVRGHRLRAGHREDAVRHHRALRRLRVQPQPRLRLRPGQLPDGLAEGQLPGGVPRRPVDQRQGRQGQDRGLPGRVPGPGHRGAGPRRQRVAVRVHRRRRDWPDWSRRRPGRTRSGRSSPSGCRPSATSARAWSSGSSPNGTRGGPFTDFYDFCARVDPSVLNKRTVESLIKAGAFDALGHPRQGLCLVFEQIVDRTLARRREADQGIMSLFGDLGRSATRSSTTTRVPIPDQEFDKAVRLAFEKEMLGPLPERPPAQGGGGGPRPARRHHHRRASRRRPGTASCAGSAAWSPAWPASTPSGAS